MFEQTISIENGHLLIYIKLSDNKIVHSSESKIENGMQILDYDGENSVVGIEMVLPLNNIVNEVNDMKD